MKEDIEKAKAQFEVILKEQLERVERIKKEGDWIDYSSLKPLIIGIIGGDGIGPFISIHAKNVLEFILQEEIKAGKIALRVIEGLTIENRAKVMKAIPACPLPTVPC